jgi:signal peptidase II
MSKTVRNWGLLIIIAGLVIGIDQFVKMRVLQTLEVGQSWRPIPAIADFIRITYSQNKGAAFGMFPFASDFFLILAFITIIAFLISFPRLPSHAWLSRISIALISGGALSNALDRILRGHVVDYVHVQVAGFSNISNLADHAITVGVILLLFDQWRAEKREQAEKVPMQAAAEDADAHGEPISMLEMPPDVPSDEPSEANPAAQ